jgi:hypothetical protein
LIAGAEQDLAEGRFITGVDAEQFLKWFGSADDGPPPGESNAI